jgi:hypothetical protein
VCGRDHPACKGLDARRLEIAVARFNSEQSPLEKRQFDAASSRRGSQPLGIGPVVDSGDAFSGSGTVRGILPRIKICGIRSRDLIVPFFAEVKEKRRK